MSCYTARKGNEVLLVKYLHSFRGTDILLDVRVEVGAVAFAFACRMTLRLLKGKCDLLLTLFVSPTPLAVLTVSA